MTSVLRVVWGLARFSWLMNESNIQDNEYSKMYQILRNNSIILILQNS